MEIRVFVLGPLDTNTYVVYDPITRDAVVIDPGDISKELVEFVKKQGLSVRAIVATHGHFDQNALYLAYRADEMRRQN